MPSFGDEIATQGWCTGAVISHADATTLSSYLVPPGADQPVAIDPADWLVVTSQTCDVIATKLEAEPYVEVLHCRSREKLRTQHKELRSTRVLDFKPNRETHDQVVLTAHAIADRYIVPREALIGLVPDGTRQLSDTSALRLLAWYSLRYGRPTWPDNFVARVSHVRAALEAAIEPLREDIAEIRVALTPKDAELENDTAYRVAVFFVVDAATWDGDVDGREAIFAAFAKFVGELDACAGVVVEHDLSSVVSGAEFTWQETRSTDEWNFASLTHRD